MLYIIKYLFLMFSFFCFTQSNALETDWSTQNESKLRLISPLTTNNDQKEIYVGLEYKLQDDWKTYWKSPGDGGFPQNINWQNSKNIKSLKILWPTPKQFEILDIKSLGYENNVIFPLKIILEDASKETLIKLDLNYLICKDICIPGQAFLELNIPSNKGDLTEYSFIMEKTLSELPNEFIDLSFVKNAKSEIFSDNELISFIVKSEARYFYEEPSVFLHTEYGLPVIDPIISLSPDSKFLEAKFIFNKNLLPEKNIKLEFLISDQNQSFIFVENNLIQNKIENSSSLLIFIIIIAFAGGLILNVMPCVLPVLSIKVLSLIKHIEKPLKIRKSFFISSLGIISSFIVLALSFIFLRYLGINVGWGMQFQQPIFLLIISIILSIFAFNLFGFFEIKLPSFVNAKFFNNSQSNNLIGDFLNGFFATLLATPCSAPFVGTAITFAFTQSFSMMFLIFVFMGVGMSFPYLLVSIFPKILYFFPKPGKWMIYLKYVMGFLLLGTLVWIGNILLNHFNLFFIIASIFLLLITLIFCYFFNVKKTILLISIIVLFSFTKFSFFISNFTFQDSDWIDFNTANIQNLINTDDIIFVDITADWCVTCQYNKINVLNTKKTKEMFSKFNITKVRGDWTKPNEKIYEFLKANNKFGIPFNVIFSKNNPNGLVLSELLTYDEINKTLNKIK